jgi:hypothetical protein
LTAGLEAFFTATAPAELSALLASSRSAAMLASVNSSVVAAVVSEATAAVSVLLALSWVPAVSVRPRQAPATDATTGCPV